MATASFEPDVGTPRRLPAPLDRVGDDMRAIFGPGAAARRVAVAQARVHRPAIGGSRRSPWRRAAAVLAAGGAAGALLGWWVLATPQGALTHLRPAAPASIARSAAPPAPPVASTAPVEVAAASPPRTRARMAAALPADDERYDVAEAAPLPPVAFAAIPMPAPARPPLAEAAAVPDETPRFADRRTGFDGCARYADACGPADVRDAELQFREAYAAAEAARADPRDLVAVRRRWARLRAIDGDRPDLLVTDYARLAGRLAWLADAAGGADEGRE